MDTCEKSCFVKMLNGEYFIPEFIDPTTNFKEETDADAINALVASVIFNNHGVVIPFQYKLTDEQFAIYEKNKHDVIDTVAWYIFDYNICRHIVEEYGVFKIIAKVIAECGAENTARVFNNKNNEELYSYYAYYILLEYFDNIVYLSNNNDTEATAEDIEKLEKLIKNISKKKNTMIL
jgi:hypothetical protein